MKTNNKPFTILELWKQKGFPYNQILLQIAGIRVAHGYRMRYQVEPKRIEVYEAEANETFMVFQYPGKFRKNANRSLNRIRINYRQEFPKPKPKRKRIKQPSVRVNIPV